MVGLVNSGDHPDVHKCTVLYATRISSIRRDLGLRMGGGAPAAAAAAPQRADFVLTNVRALAASEPNTYRHGAFCDDTGVSFPDGNSFGQWPTQFWHSAKHGMDLSRGAFARRFG